ncbi:hypothetical protein C8F01DRAFT_1244933 [Mycena amicta]|nr:hypothetical protein C8F01DRAFT_1244933 [Mycena amicta]
MQPPLLRPRSCTCYVSHPTIQYHYSDDSPLTVIPHPEEQVFLLDYDPQPTAQSISPSLAVSAVAVEEAPGAAAEPVLRNDRMYIIETIPAHERPGPMDGSIAERKPNVLLGQFKQRHSNAVLRRALLYPAPPE